MGVPTIRRGSREDLVETDATVLKTIARLNKEGSTPSLATLAYEMPRLGERVIDRSLQRLRTASAIEYNPSARGWRAIQSTAS